MTEILSEQEADLHGEVKSDNQAFARSDRTRLGVWWWTIDRWLLGAVVLLVVLGVMMSFASSPAAAARMHLDEPFHFAVRQCFFAAAGLGILLSTTVLDARGVRRASFFIWILAIGIMVVLPFIGHNAKGATRWLEFGGFSLQPSEFMKPALIILVAWMFSEGQKGQGVPGVSIAFFLYLVSIVLLLIQPDVGQTVLLSVAFGAAFWMAGVPLSWIAFMFVLGVTGLGSTYYLMPHVASRVDKFLSHGDADSKLDTHQVDRAAEAIAAGGLFGRGPGEGVMKRHVPDLHTDFIYSVAAEEYGLIFSLFLISIYAFVVIRGLSKAMKLSDSFQQVAAAGLFVLVGEQVFINVAVNLNLIPTKGMTLPLISYGGSSMLAICLTLGLALALTRRRPGTYMPG